MKLQHIIVKGVVTLAFGGMVFTACTDDVKFGSSFIEKTLSVIPSIVLGLITEISPAKSSKLL